MKRFWARLVRLNAPFIVSALREAARQLELLEPGSPAVAFPIVFHHEERFYMGEITVPDTSSPLGAAVSFVDSKNQPTTADDVPRWTSTDDGVAAPTASEDGLSASIAIGLPGAAVISCESTNDDGSTVTSQGTVTVQPGDAVIGNIEFTPPA